MPDGSARWRPLISIHALRKESDGLGLPTVRFSSIFQSTLSVRRATREVVADNPRVTIISIHALRKESDTRFTAKTIEPSYFNPRSP